MPKPRYVKIVSMSQEEYDRVKKLTDVCGIKFMDVLRAGITTMEEAVRRAEAEQSIRDEKAS